MATLETQYKNYKYQFPESTKTFEEWKHWFGESLAVSLNNFFEKESKQTMNKQDEYLVPGSSLDRLINEYDRYGSITVGFDFDNTVYDYHKTGASYENVRQLLRDLKSIGCKLICWTAQKDLPFVSEFLKENNIPCDGINTEGIPLPWESRKPFFSALLDDRSGLLQVYQELKILVELVKQRK